MNTSETFNHKAAETADEDFLQSLRDYLAQQSGWKPIVPVFRKADGTIDREKTLALPCFENFNKEKSA